MLDYLYKMNEEGSDKKNLNCEEVFRPFRDSVDNCVRIEKVQETSAPKWSFSWFQLANKL